MRYAVLTLAFYAILALGDQRPPARLVVIELPAQGTLSGAMFADLPRPTIAIAPSNFVRQLRTGTALVRAYQRWLNGTGMPFAWAVAAGAGGNSRARSAARSAA